MNEEIGLLDRIADHTAGVGVLGLGYVGLPLAVQLADALVAQCERLERTPSPLFQDLAGEAGDRCRVETSAERDTRRSHTPQAATGRF